MRAAMWRRRSTASSPCCTASATTSSRCCGASSITVLLAEHQIEAVARAVSVLDALGGVILADEVGLGKSFVAAAVAKRFAGEVDLIVPASLVDQWRQTLRQFQVEATIETHDSLPHSRRIADPSMPRLVIVDEA